MTELTGVAPACARGLCRALVFLLAATTILLIGDVNTALADDAPIVISTNSEKVETTQANLKAMVDANGAATSYYFEYATNASYEVGEFSSATRAPLVGEKPLGIKNQNASVHIDGLQPSSAYWFRVV